MSIKVENLINLDRLTQYDGLIKNKIKEHSDIQASDTVSGHVKVDTELSDTSTNPVQNKAVKNALDSKVPITRTVNGKALSSNISLSASDVGADPSGSSNSALSSAKSYTDAQVSTVNNTLTSHTGNTSNPHSVTKAQVGLGNVENKSSATIRGELTKTNVTNALGYAPYTPNEVDNKIATLETNIDWKETVATYSDIATTYPNPVDGWTVNVKDTDYTYRYNGTSWVAISANVIPKATNSIDGLLTKEDHTKYEDANSKKHTHDNKAVIDGITSTLVSNWNAAKTHADSAHARTDATKVEKSSTNGNIKINGTETVVYTHPSGTNPHGTTQSDVGLGNVNNTADKDKYVKGILDYADTSRSIQIGYAGAGLTVDEATHIAAYTEDGHKIKDLSFENLKTKLGLNGAEPNQNAFSNIVVGSTTIEADTKTDTLTLVAGSNVTLTPDATNDKITISSTDTNDKVTQTAVTDSDYTNWRSLIWGASNSGTEGFAPTTVTDGVYSCTGLSVQPSSGTIRASVFKGNLSGNIYVTQTNPSSDAAYYIPFHSNATSENKSLRTNDGIYYWTREGTTSSHGIGELVLGNNVDSTVDGNKHGVLCLYGTSTGYTEIYPTNDTEQAVYINLPATSGTLALTTSTVTAATKWDTPRTLSLTGAVTGSVSIDGSGDMSLSTSVNHTHNYAGSTSAGGSANSAIGLTRHTITSMDALDAFSSSDFTMKFATASNCDIGWVSKDGLIISLPWNSAYGAQIAIDDNFNWMGFRSKSNGTWNNWSVLLSSTNYTSYVTPTNIGAAPSSHTHTKSQITDFPSSLPASDVYAWAKASSKPSYSWDEITAKPSSFTPASHTHTSVNNITPEWSGSVAWADTGWIAAWNSDGTKIKALDKNSFAPANHTHNYLPISGGTMTGQIQKSGVSSSWIDGRSNAMIRMNSISGYSPFASIKTTNGSWEIGAYDSPGYIDELVFSYCTDANFNAGNNSITSQIGFLENGHILGNLDGNASTATSATKLNDITASDEASSTDTWRRVWFSYDDNTTGRPAYSNNLCYQSSTGSLKAITFIENGTALSNKYVPLSGNSTVNGAITFGMNDGYGIRTNTNNYGRIGDSTNQFYEVYSYQIYEDKTLLSNKYAPISHTHNYAGSTSEGGAANYLSVQQGNEINFTNTTPVTDLWFNYRNADNGSTSNDTAITAYRFGNKNASTSGVTLFADSFTGNSASASRLATARTISLTGSVTGSGTFDGSGDLTISTTVSHTHNYAGSTSAGGAANSLSGFKISTTTSLGGINDTDVYQAIGYVNGLTNDTWNANQIDGALYRQSYSALWIHQIFGDYRTGQIAVRGRNNGTWQNWRTVLDSVNYTSYAPTKTGSGASGTWGINITGSAGSVEWGNIIGKPSVFTPASHTHSYLPLSGGTMTGALNFANNIWNAVGDDVAIGDHNTAGSLGVKGLNSTPKISFLNSSGTILSSVGSDTSGEVCSSNNFNIKGTTMKLNNGAASIVYNSTTESIDFVFG